MNFEAAKRVAQRAAKRFLGQAVMPCPFMNTGLLLIVYREDDGEGIQGAAGAISGIGRMYTEERVGKKKPPRYRRSDVRIDRQERTDADGIARFLPCNPGEYHVTAVDLPDPEGIFGKPAEENLRVPAQECPVRVIPVPVLARPEVLLRLKHDDAGVPGVRVQLGDLEFEHPTDGDGRARWQGEPLEPNTYPLTLTFGDNAPHRLFDPVKQLLDAATVELPRGAHCFTFYVERLSWLTFDVVHDVPGADTQRLDQARLTVQWPEGADPKSFETAGEPMKIDDIPQASGPATRCEVVSLELPDDGEPEVYEFVEMTTA